MKIDKRWAVPVSVVLAAVLAGALLAVALRGRERTRESGLALGDVLAGLRGEGITYDVAETAALHSIDAEGVRLVGPGLEVEIYCVGSTADEAQAVRTSELLATAHAENGGPPPLQAFVRTPYFFVVRQEPVAGLVAGAADRIFGRADAAPATAP